MASIPSTDIVVDETSPRLLVKHLMRSAKAAVMKRKGSKKVRLLETELYMDWLNELNYVHSALFVSLLSLISLLVSEQFPFQDLS